MKKIKHSGKTSPGRDGSPSRLQSLRDGLEALHAGNFDVEAVNPGLIKCWEYFRCEKTDCPAYGKLRCWSIAGTLCGNEKITDRATRLGDCRKCEVYKESCSDEISELLELFNQTVRGLKPPASHAGNFGAKETEVHNASLEEMAAIVAHETRNPLHVIALAISYLKKNIREEVFSTFLDAIDQEVEKLNRMTESFLLFSAPIKIEKRACDIIAVINDAVLPLFPLARLNNISLSLPDKQQQKAVCDRQQVCQAVHALVHNAIQACAANGSIIVSVEETDGRIGIEVKDSGEGMDADVLRQACDPFFTTKARGVGLGLTIAQRVASMHGGSLELQSARHTGTTVTIIV